MRRNSNLTGTTHDAIKKLSLDRNDPRMSSRMLKAISNASSPGLQKMLRLFFHLSIWNRKRKQPSGQFFVSYRDIQNAVGFKGRGQSVISQISSFLKRLISQDKVILKVAGRDGPCANTYAFAFNPLRRMEDSKPPFNIVSIIRDRSSCFEWVLERPIGPGLFEVLARSPNSFKSPQRAFANWRRYRRMCRLGIPFRLIRKS